MWSEWAREHAKLPGADPKESSFELMEGFVQLRMLKYEAASLQCLASIVTKIPRSASNFCKLQLLVIEKEMKMMAIFTPRLAQIGQMPPDPLSRTIQSPLKLSLCCVFPPL